MALNNIRNPALFMSGGHSDFEVARLGVRAMTGNAEGVVEATTLKATANGSTPNLVTLAGGAGALVRGRDNVYQGTYFLGTTGATTVAVPTNNTSGTVRYMVMARVQDPLYDPTSTKTPDVDAAYAHIETCAAGATTVPPAYSAIPICRIDLPAGASVVTQAMITDLRFLAQPRRQRQLYTLFPSASDAVAQINIWGTWPGASIVTGVVIPPWAGHAIVICDVLSARAAGNVIGALRVNLGGVVGAGVNMDQNATSANPLRFNARTADTLPIPSNLAGTAQNLKADAINNGGSGIVAATVDARSTVLWDIQFEELVG